MMDFFGARAVRTFGWYSFCMSKASHSLHQGWVKILLVWSVNLALWFLPFRPPNVEPLLASVIPVGKNYGFFAGLLFCFFSILFHDAITASVGVWTWIVGVIYALLGAGTVLLARFKNRYVANAIYALVATLIFDAITGLAIGPIFFGQPFREALIGQIPFTINHVIGNVILAVALSPVLESLIIKNPKLESDVLLGSVMKLFRRRR